MNPFLVRRRHISRRALAGRLGLQRPRGCHGHGEHHGRAGYTERRHRGQPDAAAKDADPSAHNIALLRPEGHVLTDIPCLGGRVFPEALGPIAYVPSHITAMPGGLVSHLGGEEGVYGNGERFLCCRRDS